MGTSLHQPGELEGNQGTVGFKGTLQVSTYPINSSWVTPKDLKYLKESDSFH